MGLIQALEYWHLRRKARKAELLVRGKALGATIKFMTGHALSPEIYREAVTCVQWSLTGLYCHVAKRVVEPFIEGSAFWVYVDELQRHAVAHYMAWESCRPNDWKSYLAPGEHDELRDLRLKGLRIADFRYMMNKIGIEGAEAIDAPSAISDWLDDLVEEMNEVSAPLNADRREVLWYMQSEVADFGIRVLEVLRSG